MTSHRKLCLRVAVQHVASQRLAMTRTARSQNADRHQARTARAATISSAAHACGVSRRLEARRNAHRPGGLKVQALATGPEAPALVYVLPNGDVLVVEIAGPPAEPIKRPKEFIMGWIESFATSGGADRKRATASRCCATPTATARPDVRTVFLDGLNSPFGMALVGNDLYVANTDADRALSLPGRATPRSPRRATTLTDAARRADQPPLDQEPRRQPGRHASSMSASAPTATSPRTASRPRRTAPRSGRSTARTGALARLRHRACATPTAWPSSRGPARCGPSSTSATSSAPTSCPTT